MKLLNQYLDSLAANSGVEDLKLHFYIADKNNKKAKKFFLFESTSIIYNHQSAPVESVT